MIAALDPRNSFWDYLTSLDMSTPQRHQCLIYEGPPSRHLPALAATLQQKLNDNYRCLYLNTPVMVAGMRSYPQGLDIWHNTSKGSLVLSSDRHHLLEDRFEIDRLIAALEDALDRSIKDGFAGLWVTGDMSWEFGPQRDFSKLLEYETRLEEFLQQHPTLSGICQYHADTLPPEALRQVLLTHPSIFVNDTLSRINPDYLHATNPVPAPKANRLWQ